MSLPWVADTFSPSLSAKKQSVSLSFAPGIGGGESGNRKRQFNRLGSVGQQRGAGNSGGGGTPAFFWEVSQAQNLEEAASVSRTLPYADQGCCVETRTDFISL